MADDRIRLGQVIGVFGPGAMLDLPERSVLVQGLDQWEMFGTGTFKVIEEPRLARLLHQRLKDDPSCAHRQSTRATPSARLLVSRPQCFRVGLHVMRSPAIRPTGDVSCVSKISSHQSGLSIRLMMVSVGKLRQFVSSAAARMDTCRMSIGDALFIKAIVTVAEVVPLDLAENRCGKKMLARAQILVISASHATAALRCRWMNFSNKAGSAPAQGSGHGLAITTQIHAMPL
jgi:hypothetical protein